MKFDIITIFPKIFDAYFGESIIARAVKNNLIDIQIHNLRDHTTDKHKTVDDTPYGGGAGMVLKIEPIWRCVQSILNFKFKILNEIQIAKLKNYRNKKMRIILFSAKGKRYTQQDARRLAKYDNIIMICGRYEGVDERVAKYIADEEISIGDYVLTGGEVPAMVLVDSIMRLIPGVLGNAQSLAEESFSKIENSVVEYPQYTKPEEFSGWKVPRVLLEGHHKKIADWRSKHENMKSGKH